MWRMSALLQSAAVTTVAAILAKETRNDLSQLVKKCLLYVSALRLWNSTVVRASMRVLTTTHAVEAGHEDV